MQGIVQIYQKSRRGLNVKPDHLEDMPVVNVYYRDKQIGLYHANLVGEYSLILRHGGISFPVGTALTIQFRKFSAKKSIHKRIMAIVRNNSNRGMFLSLQAAV